MCVCVSKEWRRGTGRGGGGRGKKKKKRRSDEDEDEEEEEEEKEEEEEEEDEEEEEGGSSCSQSTVAFSWPNQVISDAMLKFVRKFAGVDGIAHPSEQHQVTLH